MKPGTWYCGARHHKAKLDESDVLEILAAIDRRNELRGELETLMDRQSVIRDELKSLTDTAIAKRYGVAQTTVSNIARGITWRRI